MLEVAIEKRLGSFHLDISFSAGDSEVLSFLGASGAGKSMLLKCIAGIERPDRGRIVLNGKVLFDSAARINLSPRSRRAGYLFQQYALFPNMTVAENIAAGVRDRSRVKQVVSALEERFRLTGLEKRYPHQLSGGQQQRTALARICASEPDILLLDEPFSALDRPLRFSMAEEIRDVIRELNKPVLLVSHDRDEVFRLSERVAVLDQGRIEALDEKQALFSDPKSLSAAVMIGCKNLSPLKILAPGRGEAEAFGIVLELPSLSRGHTHIGIRSDAIRPAEDGKEENRVCCRIVDHIEDPFGRVVFLRPEAVPNARPIAWEISLETWDKIKAREIIEIVIPPQSVWLLTERKRMESHEKSKS